MQGRVLTVERFRQMSDNAWERDRRRDEADRREAERTRVAEERELARSRRQTHQDIGPSEQVSSSGRYLTGYWTQTPRGQRWVATPSRRPNVSVEELAESLQRQLAEMTRKQKEWEAENSDRERKEKEQLERDQASRREHQCKRDVELKQIWDDTNQELAREKKKQEEKDRRQKGELGSRRVERSRERSPPQRPRMRSPSKSPRNPKDPTPEKKAKKRRN